MKTGVRLLSGVRGGGGKDLLQLGVRARPEVLKHLEFYC